jgi:hypothetical protein
MALQVSSGSQREKWVAALIPATIILLGGFLYITFYALPAFNETEKKFQRIADRSVGLDVVAELEAEAQKLRDDRAELQRTISSFDEEVAKKSESFHQLSPTARHSAVTALCRDHGVAILQDQPVDSLKLPSLRKKSIETLQSLVPEEATSFRELTLSGDYGTIVTLLKKLPKVPGVIPVSVTFKKTKVDASPSPAASWTVRLLM